MILKLKYYRDRKVQMDRKGLTGHKVQQAQKALMGRRVRVLR